MACAQTRKLNADFSDAKPTFMIIYQIAIVGVMMLVIVFLASVDLSIQVLLISVATAVVTVVSLLVLLLPKLAPGAVAVCLSQPAPKHMVALHEVSLCPLSGR